MKKVFAVLILCACVVGTCIVLFYEKPEKDTGVSQEEYDKVVAERDDYKEKYEWVRNEYSEHLANDDIEAITGGNQKYDKKDDNFSNKGTNQSLGNTGTTTATTGKMNALKSAKHYLEFMPFSYKGLVEQLEYEKYSNAEAVYAADNCGADWNEQAVKKAKSYLDIMAFSKDSLIEQLEFEGFTHEQAVYGVTKNGY